MEEPIKPIFFAFTRSFWFGWLPAGLTLVDTIFSAVADPAVAEPVAWLLAVIVGVFGVETDAEAVHAVMLKLAPVYALIVAQQRAGRARPYTTEVNKETTK